MSESNLTSSSAGAGGAGFVAGGRTVDAGRGWSWIASGFGLFMKQPGIWILLLIVLIVCWALIGIVPVVGSIAIMLLYPVFTAGVMLGCRALDEGGELEVAHAFAGFKRNTSDLVVLGALSLVMLVIVLVPTVLIMGIGSFLAMMHGDVAKVAALGLTFLLAMLVMLALSIPAYMAIWFAPALVALNQMKPGAALQASFMACLKNFIPFLVYGVILFVFCIVAAIPLMLGYLVMGPVLLASVYTAYRDIFYSA